MPKDLTKKQDIPFLPATQDGLPKLDPALAKELDETDKEGYEEPRETLPIVTLRQKDKKDNSGRTVVEAGGFKCYDAVFENIQDADGSKGLELTIILDQRSRIYWDSIEASHPACRSRDWQTGVGTPGGECLKCPLSLWKKNGDRPACAEEINLLCYDHSLRKFYVITFKGSGLRPYNNLKVLLKRSEIPLHFSKIHLTAVYQQEPHPHYIPHFEVLNNLDLETARMMKAFRKELSAVFGKTVAEAATKDDENGQSVNTNELPSDVTPVDQSDLPY